MNALVIDVGGTNVKVIATGRKQPIKIPSGSKMTAAQMAAEVKKATLRTSAICTGLLCSAALPIVVSPSRI
jgi:hypothetical protein